MADFAAPLQTALLKELRLIAVVSSLTESFFSQVDVNTTVIIAEKREQPHTSQEEKIRFVMLKRRITELVDVGDDYWRNMTKFADIIEGLEDHTENADFRLTVIPAKVEREALSANPRAARNWSRYLRAPHSYFEIFGLT